MTWSGPAPDAAQMLNTALPFLQRKPPGPLLVDDSKKANGPGISFLGVLIDDEGQGKE